MLKGTINGAKTLRITTLSLTTFDIKGLFARLGRNDTQQYNSGSVLSVVMLSVVAPNTLDCLTLASLTKSV